MLRSLSILAICGTVLVLTGGSLYWYRDLSSGYQLHQALEEKRQLQHFVDKLTDETRVAEVLVTDQKVVDGSTQTTLLFVEYARDSTPLPPRYFTIAGSTAHIDAMVIKFDRDYLAKDDPLRGHSIALFCRLYGDGQSPGQAFHIDEPGKIPPVYRGDNAEDASRFEAGLWNNFWRLTTDKAYREENGVRIANGEGVWGPFQIDRLYTLTLAPGGGLSLSSEPLKGIYAEALRHRAS